MTIVAADNRSTALEELTTTLWKAFPGSSVEQFSDPLLCVKYICNHAVDLVFLEIAMRPANGTELLKVIRTQKPEVPVVLLSDTERCWRTAAGVRADEYLIRPITVESLQSFAEKVNISGQK